MRKGRKGKERERGEKRGGNDRKGIEGMDEREGGEKRGGKGREGEEKKGWMKGKGKGGK